MVRRREQVDTSSNWWSEVDPVTGDRSDSVSMQGGEGGRGVITVLRPEDGSFVSMGLCINKESGRRDPLLSIAPDIKRAQVPYLSVLVLSNPAVEGAICFTY